MGTILVVIVVVGGVFLWSAMMNAGIKNAKTLYDAALTELRKNPIDADVRQKCLNAGRFYANLTRNQKGVTVFDEIALMNDINAACAGAATVTLKDGANWQNSSTQDRLKNLEELKDEGLLNEEEYSLKRREILRDI